MSEENIDIKPKSNCKKCFGRGFVGMNVITKRNVVCDCVMKQADKIKKAQKAEKDKKA